MRWLIDGYNVIRRDPDLRAREAESLEAGRAALLALVARAARGGRDDFTVVFDGARRAAPAAAGRLHVVFSQPPQTADDVLIAQARAVRDGAIVVSSDRVVADAARRAGAVVLGAEIFIDTLRTSEAGSAADDAAGDDDEDDDRRGPRGGNPRRRSAEERAAERAVSRLRSALTGRRPFGY